MRKHFERPFYLSELLTARVRPLFEEADGGINLAFEYVDTVVCAHADHFVGNTRSVFAKAVCYEREEYAPRLGFSAPGQVASDGSSTPDCKDVYGRSPQKGRA